MADSSVEIVIANPPAGETRQPDDETLSWTPNDSIKPPSNLEALANLTQVSPLRRSCIEAIVRNTVGLGVSVVAREGRAEDVADEDEPRKVMDTLDALARRDVRSYSPTFAKLLRRPKWDEQEVGNGYIEVSRSRLTGEIDGLFHAPGKRVRRLTDRSGWIVGPRKGSAVDRVRFYNFGEKVQYDAQGKPTPVLASQGRRWDRNELIPFQLYTSESRDYGLPPDTQLAWDYLGDKNAAETNVSFFDSSGVPPAVIFVQGEQKEGSKRITVNPKTVQGITDTLRAGGDRKRKVAIVPLPPGAQANKIDLASLSDRDVGFVGYRADNRRRTLGAWRLSPVFVADIEDAGKYTAEVEKSITKEQVFDPEQADWQEVLADTLLRDLGFPHLTFDFAEIDIESDETRRGAANDAADHSAITYGEYRDRMGLSPLPEADEGAEPTAGQVPHGWNSTLMTTAAATPEPPIVDDVPPEDPPPEVDPETGEPIEKAEKSAIRADFEAGIEDAIRRVSSHVGSEFDLAAVTVEKDGERIVVAPVA